MSGKLKPKEEKFCRFYLRHPDGLLAAKRAGYSGKNLQVKAEKLLQSLPVLERLRELQREACDALGIDRSWIMLQAAEIYRRCMEEHPEKRWDTSTKSYIESGEYTFDGQGALRALRFIADLLGETPSETSGAVTLIDDMEGGGEDG